MAIPARSSFVCTLIIDQGKIITDECAGEVRQPRCTLACAPPEVVCADMSCATVRASPSHDIWGLAVTVFECICRQPALCSRAQVRAAAMGDQPYPWELPTDKQPPAWRQSRLRALLQPCLARNAAERPTAQQLLADVAGVGTAS